MTAMNDKARTGHEHATTRMCRRSLMTQKAYSEGARLPMYLTQPPQKTTMSPLQISAPIRPPMAHRSTDLLLPVVRCEVRDAATKCLTESSVRPRRLRPPADSPIEHTSVRYRLALAGTTRSGAGLFFRNRSDRGEQPGITWQPQSARHRHCDAKLHPSRPGGAPHRRDFRTMTAT